MPGGSPTAQTDSWRTLAVHSSLLLPRLVFTTRGTGVLVVCIQRRFAQQTLSLQDSEAASFWLPTKLSQGAAFHWLPLLVLAATLS